MVAQDDERSAGERTRARILQEALPLFASLGYDGTSVRAIAGAAEVNVATLAYHFGDKEGLYKTLVSRLYADLATLDLSGVEAGGDLLGAHIRLIWRFVREHELHVRLLHRHMLDHGRHTEEADSPTAQPLLERADLFIGLFRPDSDLSERRFLLFSVLHLMVRFALEPADVLRRHYGVEGPSDAAVEDWLVKATHRLLGTGAL